MAIIINPNSVLIPDNVEFIVNEALHPEQRLGVNRLIDGKFLLWERGLSFGFGPIDVVTDYASRKFFEDLGIGFHGDKHPEEFDPARVRELFRDYISLSRTLGAAFTYNTFYNIETEDDYGIGKHLTEQLKTGYAFLYYALGFGNQKGAYWTVNGFVNHNSETLDLPYFREFTMRTRTILNRYEATGFDVNRNLLYILCIGANMKHPAPEWFVPLLLDEELQRTFPIAMQGLALMNARSIYATRSELEKLTSFSEKRVRFNDLALKKLNEVYVTGIV